MAHTTVATGATLIKNVVSEKLWREAIKESYFSRFTSDDGSSIIHRKRDLAKGTGEKITFGIRMRLTGAGVGEGQVLEGNEEALTIYDSSVTLEEKWHAVRDRGEMDRQRAAWDIDEDSKAALKDWATEYIDSYLFSKLLASPTKIIYRDTSAGAISGTTSAATAKTGMSATNSVITLNLISAVKAWARTGGNRTVNPLLPVKVDGKDYYVLLVSPNVMYSLKTNSDFQTAMREAQNRGADNPLFQDATAIWDNVVIHEHENIAEYSDGGGGSVRYAPCLFLGKQALCYAVGNNIEVRSKKFDYDRQHGYAWGVIHGAAKPVFNSKDYGSIGVYIACSNVTGL